MTTKFIFRHPIKNLLAFRSRLLGICFVVFVFTSPLKSQTVIYTQPFSGTLTSSGWVVTNLTSPWGNDSFFGYSNLWQVGDAESGLSANNCGDAYLGDQSLYMEATGLASGAAYLSDINTNRRAASPNISTIGYTGVILEFDFIGNGEGTTDKGYVVYSIDGGTSWVAPTGAPTAVSPALGSGGSLNNLKSQICGSGQGLWTHVTWNMPVTCEEITNLRVGFVWQSNNNSAGSDPSIAVDDIKITATLTPAPIELLSFAANYDDKNKVNLKWATASENNNDFFTIERSLNGLTFSEIEQIDGAGNSSHLIEYESADINPPLNGMSYYRLKQTDYNGEYKYSEIVSVDIQQANLELVNIYNSSEHGILEVTVNCSGDSDIGIELYDVSGNKIFFANSKSIEKSLKINIPTSSLSKGVYIFKLSSKNQIVTKKIKI